MATAEFPQTSPGSLICRSTLWRPRQGRVDDSTIVQARPGDIRWFDLAAGPEEVDVVLNELNGACPELTPEMLKQLLEPDALPEEESYEDGGIGLATLFSVEARREEEEDGRPRAPGLLIFRPVELLATYDWLLTCWHQPRWHQPRVFPEDDPPVDFKLGSADGALVLDEINKHWQNASCETAAELVPSTAERSAAAAPASMLAASRSLS